MQEYMRTTKQVLIVSETVSVKRRNQDLRKQTRHHGLLDSQIPLVPGDRNPYQRKYICTHGWAERELSNGKRKVYKLRRTDYPCQFLAQVVRTNGEWGITLKREVYRHNHPISTDIYMSYPGFRQVLSRSPLMPGIELLVESEAGNSSIHDYIRQNSDHRVTMHDVRYLVGRVRQTGGTLLDDEAVAETVVSFKLKNPKKCVYSGAECARRYWYDIGDYGSHACDVRQLPREAHELSRY